MANRDNLSFMFSFISLVSSVGDPLQQQLRRLPAGILAWMIVLAATWYVITHVFKFLFKNKQPIQLGPLKLSYSIMFSIPTMAAVVMLLFL